jgi:hypothetical protein
VASAAGERADSVSSCGPLAGSEGSRSGASSTITCALVPPTPKLLTPARRGAASRGQGRSRLLTLKGVASKSMAGFGAS